MILILVVFVVHVLVFGMHFRDGPSFPSFYVSCYTYEAIHQFVSISGTLENH